MLLLRTMTMGPLMAAHEIQTATATGANPPAVIEPTLPQLHQDAIALIRAHPAQARTVAEQIGVIACEANILPPQKLCESFSVMQSQVGLAFGMLLGCGLAILSVVHPPPSVSTVLAAFLSGPALGAIYGGFRGAITDRVTGAHHLENKSHSAVMLFAAELAMLPDVRTHETEARAELWMREVVDVLFDNVLSKGPESERAREVLRNLYLIRHHHPAANVLRALGGDPVISSMEFKLLLVERSLSGDEIAANQMLIYARESRPFREGLAIFAFRHHERLRSLARNNNAPATLALKALVTLDQNHRAFDCSVFRDVNAGFEDGTIPTLEIGKPLLT